MQPRTPADPNPAPPRARAPECPIARAGRMLERHPGLRVRLLMPDWDTVDEARRRAEARGLDACLSVHHAMALAHTDFHN